MNLKNSHHGAVSAAFTAGVLLLFMSEIAYAQYVDPKRSTNGKDLTQIHSGLFSSNKAPFEYQTQGSWSIGYSLVKESFGGDFYRLTLVFKNVGATNSSIAPAVTLNDGDGILLPTWSYDFMYRRATQLANSSTVSVPPPTQHTLSTTTTTQGTVTDQKWPGFKLYGSKHNARTAGERSGASSGEHGTQPSSDGQFNRGNEPPNRGRIFTVASPILAQRSLRRPGWDRCGGSVALRAAWKGQSTVCSERSGRRSTVHISL